MSREADLRDALEAANKKLEEMNKFIEELNKVPLQIARVAGISKDRILLDGPNGLVEGERPSHVKLKVGDKVLVHPMTGAIVKHASLEVGGRTGTVEEVLAEGKALVRDTRGEVGLVTSGDLAISAGDRVVLQGSVVTAVLPREGSSPYLQPLDTKVKWEDVIGQQRAVRALQEAVEWPRKHKALFERFGRRASKGVLLFGPPGCGKTLLAKAAVTAINEACKTPGFFYVKGPEILDKYVGETESRIREIFAAARAHKVRTGESPVLFIDEADALLRRRGSSISSDVGNTIVPQFLSEMDGLEEGGPLVLLATNAAGALDEAVVRPGRIDNTVEVGRPGPEDTMDLFEYYLKGVPLAEQEDYPDYIVARIWKTSDLRVGDKFLSDQMSGAIVAGLVQDAISVAIRRNIENPKTKDKGLLRADLAAATVAFTSNRKGMGDVQKEASGRGRQTPQAHSPWGWD